MNYFLQKYYISIISLKKKRLDFHSRYSAKKRVYKYKIINREGSLSLFRNRAWHIQRKLNVKLLEKELKCSRNS